MSSNFINKEHRKKGQVGETVTWIVATVIIIVILLLSISVAVTDIFDFKKFNYMKKTDVLASKSFFSYLLTESEGGTSVYKQLGAEDNLNEFNGVLAEKIFKKFYGDEYVHVWIGIQDTSEWQGPGSDLGFLKNDYFGGEASREFLNFVGETFNAGGIIPLNKNKNKNIILFLSKL